MVQKSPAFFEQPKPRFWHTSVGKGLRELFPKVDYKAIRPRDLIPHLRLVPYDILVIIFITQVMLPVWAGVLLVTVNVGTWWCYHRIPQFLRTVSGPEGEGILIPGTIVEYFARFIHSCGIHHRAHYGLMFAMMAGFHTMMTGQLWGRPAPPGMAETLAWSSFSALLLVDFLMYWVSLRTLQELRRDKLEEAKEYTDELKRSNEELEQFAYIASHDLRSPLRGIMTLTKWIGEDVEANRYTEQTHENLRLLNSRTQRMDNLLNDLLQYSRVGRVETEIETFRPAALAQQTFDLLGVEDSFSLHVVGEEVSITDYRIPYDMILNNLIANAVKHHDQDTGNIWFTTGLVGNKIVMQIEDDGPGIDAQYRKKVFDVFTTLDRRDEKEATGMGLAIVKKIIRHRGGMIWIDDSEYGGARFIVTIPLSKLTKTS